MQQRKKEKKKKKKLPEKWRLNGLYVQRKTKYSKQLNQQKNTAHDILGST